MGARRTGGLLAAALLAAAAAGCRPRAAPDLAPFSAATEPGRTVFFVPVRERLVALTFDDGPSEPYTGRILDVLRDRGVPATFFLIGANAERLPALARRVAAEGHLVGNHSYAHRRFDQSTAGEIARDIADGARAIEAATGVRPAWFRPPYGINGPGMEDACRAGGQVIAGWSADANDWNPHPVEELVERLAAQAVPGDILLLHDGWETRPDADRSRTAAAVSLVIDRLKAAGFRFVTVADLLRAAGPPLAAFANGARLLGIQAPAAPLRPGERFTVRAFWDLPAGWGRDGAAPDVFLHVTAPGGVLRLQGDQALPPPGDVRDRVRRHRLMIPRGTPPGRYDLRLGLFDPRRPDRGGRVPVSAALPREHRAVCLAGALEVAAP